MGLILLIVLVILLVGAVPSWPYSRNWGYGPSGILGLLLVILLVLLLLNMIPWGFSIRDHGDDRAVTIRANASCVMQLPRLIRRRPSWPCTSPWP